MATPKAPIAGSPIARAAATLTNTQGQTLDTPAATTANSTYVPATPPAGGKAGNITPRYSSNYEKPDISTTTALSNSIYQNLMGRNATQAEIQKYHEEFLKYAASHPSSSSVSQLAQGEVVARQTTSTSTGLSEGNFINNLVSGTAEAKDYTAATTYFDAMRSSMNKFGGGY
jgi:hypothetical protein